MKVQQTYHIVCAIRGELIDYSSGRSGLCDFYMGTVDSESGRLSLDRTDREVSLFVKDGTPLCCIQVGDSWKNYPVTEEGVAVLTRDALKALIEATSPKGLAGEPRKLSNGMVLVKVQEASEAVLDWAVAMCEGMDPSGGGIYDPVNNFIAWRSISRRADFSRNAALALPIIEREDMWVASARYMAPSAVPRPERAWMAKSLNSAPHEPSYGPTLLIAAMRCYVTSKLGEQIEVPAKLLM
ncbi:MULTISPECIES: phage protein NinX family protein [Cupriavidus]|uniref:DUF2591 domain-containing protein n=2 Tax=Cupriavidus TaxID=106589 RepID=A0A3G8GXL6_9BURK|nr:MULTISPECIES: phage protein NinX family protein [Cupriavidus]AZG12082.1 DUF2591 domain-containing protein [Cupriavidus pauculus]QBP14403.1 DUF2591 domain-containing protein [Cupriavidus metallidurans]